MALGFLKRFSGDPSEAALRRARKQVDAINALGDATKKLTDAQLKAKTKEFRERLEKEETLDDLLPEAFAVVREAADRVIKERHFDVQLMGGISLHGGNITEMKTGEGKTLTATLPVYLNALAGKGVHVVTVNEYLARRDTEWMGQIYQFLGLTVGAIYHEQPAEEKRQAYAADVTYGTNNEFGFDYLRDNMVTELDQAVQRDLSFAIVDEVDSILIDESRTPLIISAPAEESGKAYAQFAGLIPKLQKETDYTVDEKRRAAILTDDGIKKMESFLGVENIYDAGGLSTVHHLEQALQAHALFRRDKEYVVKDGEVVIVDEFTGRLMPGRRFSEGLHQAIEAKEGVTVQQESRTMATITFQNYFRLYEKLGGMTGTALTEKEEFQKIYSSDVVVIPTHRELIREDQNDKIYKTEQAKINAIVQDVKERHEKKQPVLLGTIAVQKSERLSQALKAGGIKHEVLNAKNHAREAEIIAAAGEPGAVTVSTNMAGRGTDIKLGKGVAELGGLHVIGSERHEARRIDNQLRGRAGRQGDPGSSQFYVSLDDDLMRIFAGDKIGGVMERLKLPDDQPIEAKIISRSIESAQKKVEGHNFDIRKHVVEYDDVMNAHREVIYARRRKVLEKEDMKQDVLDMFAQEADLLLAAHTAGDDPGEWNYQKIAEGIVGIVPTDGALAEQLSQLRERDKLREGIVTMLTDAYGRKEAEQGEENQRKLERLLMLQTIDRRWVDHLDAMEHLREGIGLRGYGQRDPLTEYKAESYRLFEQLLGDIQAEVTHTIFKVSLREEQQEPSEMAQAAKNAKTPAPGDAKKPKPPVIGQKEPGEEPIDEPPAPQPPAAGGDPSAPSSGATITIKTPDGAVQTMTPEQAEAAATTPAPSEQTTKEGSATITVKARSKKAGNTASKSSPKVGRNDPCPCGSGLKYKKCGLINSPEHQAALAKKK
jgi:preprotein translocase subunit SecA